MKLSSAFLPNTDAARANQPQNALGNAVSDGPSNTSGSITAPPAP